MSSEQQPSQSDSEADVIRLVEFLATRDAPCPLCGYNLHGLTRDICPECGRQLQLSVGLTDPFLRAWVILAVAVFSGVQDSFCAASIDISGPVFPEH